MERMKELVEKINLYSHHYYVLDSPIVSDKEFDALYDELIALEEKTGTVLPNSPTLKVGGETLDKFEKFPHKNRLYSLDKAQNKTQLKKWYDGVKKEFPDATFSASYKFDGLTVVCEYQNGFFVKAGTRGNGTVGEDVTEQVKTIGSLPLKINYKGNLIVQGEGIVTLSNLEKYNKTAKEKLKNARNAASGGLRNLNPKVTRQRRLDLICYNVPYIEDKTLLNSQEQIQEFLKNNNFLTSPFFEVSSTFDQLEKLIDTVDSEKSKINYLIDGVVINVNSLNQREKFGYTAKFPKWAIAYKFEAMETSTILKEVLWQVGRTGKITPIAVVEPVELAGAIVQRATLNNIEDINKKNLEIGSRVFIRRSNEVIPEILSLAQSLPGAKKIEPLEVCPSCAQPLVMRNMNLFCENHRGCKEQIAGRLTHFCSKEAMNIEGLSIQTLNTLIDNLGISNPSELYALKEEQLLTLEGFKKKKSSNLISSIENSKNARLSNFIFALGILNVGTKSAKDLANAFKTFEKFALATEEQLKEVKDIGEITARTIREFFEDAEMAQEVSALFDAGIQIEQVTNAKQTSIFFGKTVVLTGSFETLTRQEATAILEQNGANVTSSVSAKTDFVIYGENAGSKLSKAQELGVKTLEADKVFGKII